MEIKDVSSTREPLLVHLAPGLDAADYHLAIELRRAALAEYDPLTQTSSRTIYAGSYKTYEPSYSGMWASKDDENVTDY